MVEKNVVAAEIPNDMTVDWNTLKSELRGELTGLMTEFRGKFDVQSAIKLPNLEGTENSGVDNSMYAGTGGVAFGIYKYLLLLRKEG
jgi:hypothetical protein